MTGVTFSPELPGAGVYLSVTLAWGGLSHSCRALVDSGAAGNFIDTALVQRLKIPQEALETSLSVSALDGQPIGDGKVTSATTPFHLHVGNHNENISLHGGVARKYFLARRCLANKGPAHFHPIGPMIVL